MHIFLPLFASVAIASLPLPKPRAIDEYAQHLLVSHGWKVAVGKTIVPGTEQNRAQLFDCVYYCAKLDGSSARIVFAEQSTGESFHPLGIAPDGTVTASVYPGKLLIVGPMDEPGKRGLGESVDTPGRKGNEGTELLHANAAGLVARPDRLNVIVPVYFIPMAAGKPQPDKAVELCKRDSGVTHMHRSGFHVTDDWVVWDGGSYEVATGKIRKRVAESGVVEDLGIDGDLVLVERNATVDRKAVRELVPTDLKTGAPTGRYPMAPDSEFVTVHDGIAYVLNPIPWKEGEKKQRAEIAAFSLAKPADVLRKTIVPFQAKQRFQSRQFLVLAIGGKGFTIHGDPASAVEWVAREKKK